MKTKLTFLCVAALTAVMLIPLASAGNISPDALGYGALGSGNKTPSFGSMCSGWSLDYCNTGGINGEVDAWPINFGVAVSNSFVGYGQALGADFGVWLFPGDHVQQVDWCISTADFCGGSTIAAGTAQVGLGPPTECNGGSCDFGVNQYGYDIQSLEFSFGQYGVSLSGGTYYLTLQNAVESLFGDPVYWDENGGPSLAFENYMGSVPSEAFAIDGYRFDAAPEPGTLVLGGTGLVLLAGALHRRRR